MSMEVTALRAILFARCLVKCLFCCFAHAGESVLCELTCAIWPPYSNAIQFEFHKLIMLYIQRCKIIQNLYTIR